MSFPSHITVSLCHAEHGKPACPIEVASFRPCDFIMIVGEPLEVMLTLECKSDQPPDPMS